MSKSTKIAPKSKLSKASKATKSPAKPLKSKSPAPKPPAKSPAKSAPKSTRPTTLTPSLHVRLAALPPTTRALKMGELASQVHELIRKAGEKNHGQDWYPWVMDLYFDGAQLFVITAEGGKLYQYNIAVDENDRASIGERVAVMTKFTKVSEEVADEDEPSTGEDEISDNYVMASADARTGQTIPVRPVTRIFREASGRVRWVSISCTNVLNRVGEIDSAALFDSFIAHANATGEYPIRKLLHLQPDTTWRNGQADFLARDGHLYITSGLFDEDSFLADVEIAVREADPGYLGESIGYLPTSAPTMLEVNRNVRVPVYLTGINREISGLAETDAAALFTTTAQLTVNRGGSTPMHKTIKDKLMKLAAKAGKEEEMEEFVATADNTNRAITRDGLVTRAGDGANAGEGDEDGEEVEADDTDTADAPIADATERTADAGDDDADADADALRTTRAEDASATEIADATEDADEMEVEFSDEEVGALIDALVVDDRFLSKLETLVAELRAAREQDAADLAALTENVRALTDITTEHADALETVVTTIERIEAVSTRDDTERVRELRRDIPARQLRTGATYRPREQAAPVVSARHEDTFSLEDIAAQTLREVQAA